MAQKGTKPTRGQRIGRWGEETAARFLEARGYQILGRNVRTRYGEIDLLVRNLQDGELVFVEVKTRTSGSFGLPEDAVDGRKLEHMGRAADTYLEQHPEFSGDSWRFDVVAIQGKPGGNEEDIAIEHFENISS